MESTNCDHRSIHCLHNKLKMKDFLLLLFHASFPLYFASHYMVYLRFTVAFSLLQKKSSYSRVDPYLKHEINTSDHVKC